MARLIMDYLEATAERFPAKLAVAWDGGTLTFSELRIAARRIATYIIHQGGHKQPIAVFLPKTGCAIASFLGAAYSGNFYTPIDTDMPEARIQKILETLQPSVIVTDEEHQERAKKFCTADAHIVTYEAMQEIVADSSAVDARIAEMIDTDVLYVLFTSGSTGNPKGVIIAHKGVIDYTEWVTKKFAVDELHRIANQAPFYFDNSVLDIYQMLKTGASLYIIPQKYFSFPVRLLEYLREHSINMIFWVPSAFAMPVLLRALKTQHVDTLEKVLFAGEVMPVSVLNQWRKAYPEAIFANLYGPTEITVDCTAYIVDREFDNKEALPIGTPCRNTDILVLNEKDCLVTGTEIGELCVRGTGLSYGYYRNREKTEEVFVQNPLNDAYQEIIYRTGDLVHYNDRGELMYDGRKDFQIKHMGYRIELGEIETAASSIDGVQRVACVYDSRCDEITLFYTGDAESQELQHSLTRLVPSYMMPRHILRVPFIPLNANGKIDRMKLAESYGKEKIEENGRS